MKKRMPVLIINSYAGSLAIAASRENYEIIGSYEDAAYGLEVQSANFPEFDYRDTVEQWPEKQDLRDCLVIAHPPCAAFSVQNNHKSTMGLDAPKFQQTKTVIDYALRNKCAALAVESVPGALEGARTVHDEFAERYGYNVFRVMQNACDFGVPQWRPRFWCIFMPKKRRALVLEKINHEPVDMSSVRMPEGSGQATDRDLAKYARQRELLTEATDLGFARRILEGRDDTYGLIVNPLRDELERRGDPAPAYVVPQTGRRYERGSTGATARQWCRGCSSTFICTSLRIVDPYAVGCTVTATSWWAWPKMGRLPARTLYLAEYGRVAGFPDSYKFPCHEDLVRGYLSRGVCPAVAQWVLRSMETSVKSGARRGCDVVRPGETVVVGDARRRSRRSA